MDFKDKVVWITGASSGIGEHLAYTFSELNAKLVLSARNEKELERVRLNCQGNNEIMVCPFDVTDFGGLPEIVAGVKKRFGFINILINNAGIGQRSFARETDLEVDRRLMEVNYLGPVALTKAVLPNFLEQEFGHIVVISSILGKVSVPGRSAYAGSKHALHGFFDSLRAELQEENISVTLICPGYVHTNLPVNALTGDGSPNEKPEQDRKGLDPALFAQKAVQAIAAKKKEVNIGGLKEVGAVYLRRLFPALFFLILRRLSKT